MEYTITIDKKEYKAILREPLFNDYQMAQIAARLTGNYNTMAAGSALIQHCWTEGDEVLKGGDESKDPKIVKAYMTLATEVYNDLFLETGVEIKKK